MPFKDWQLIGRLWKRFALCGELVGKATSTRCAQARSMILVDSSAWVEYIRDTGSEIADALDRLLESEAAICEVILMEILVGARDESHLQQLQTIMARPQFVPIESRDYEVAAALYRQCRRGGETVRKLTDCLIGAVAVRVGSSILHRDADFSVLARHTRVQSYPLTAP